MSSPSPAHSQDDASQLQSGPSTPNHQYPIVMQHNSGNSQTTVSQGVSKGKQRADPEPDPPVHLYPHNILAADHRGNHAVGEASESFSNSHPQLQPRNAINAAHPHANHDDEPIASSSSSTVPRPATNNNGSSSHAVSYEETTPPPPPRPRYSYSTTPSPGPHALTPKGWYNADCCPDCGALYLKQRFVQFGEMTGFSRPKGD